MLLYNSSIPLLHVQDEESYHTTMGKEMSKQSKTQPINFLSKLFKIEFTIIHILDLFFVINQIIISIAHNLWFM